MNISFEISDSDVEYDTEPVSRARPTPQKDSALGSGRGSPAGPRAALINIIEGEIIPRLFLTHCDRLSQVSPSTHIEKQAIVGDSDDLDRLFLSGDTAEIVNRLQAFMDHGVRRERVYLDFLAPVARRLGTIWEEGYCTFEEMATGLSCVDLVLQELCGREHDGDEQIPDRTGDC